MLDLNEIRNRRDYDKPWPKNVPWAEPLFGGSGMYWDDSIIPVDGLDEKAGYLSDVKSYYDDLVIDGVLDEDYCLVESDPENEGFSPEIGEEYWVDNGFDLRMWEEDLTEHMNLLKVDYTPDEYDAAEEIEKVTEYTFINQNLLRQAFTRRSFAVEYGISGSSEELEYIGDAVLDMCVTEELVRNLTEVDINRTDAPFRSKCDEGELTRLRQHYISKDYLASRFTELGLDRYILFGSTEKPTQSAYEDTMEALIGAVAIDSGWDKDEISSAVDQLLIMQFDDRNHVESMLRKTFYEIFNSWHQKHFGNIPSYEMTGIGPYCCTMTYRVPENDKGINEYRIVDVERETRAAAREFAAELAYRFVTSHGLWKDIRQAGIAPDLENSINQLQELFQKGYLDNEPKYTLEQLKTPVLPLADMSEEIVEEIRKHPDSDIWRCTLIADDVMTIGYGKTKIRAKKDAAFSMLKKLGINND